tara:strand:- start:428 stop:613 length:186 start_codon:yes stop_codon:yes gene_type:complete
MYDPLSINGVTVNAAGEFAAVVAFKGVLLAAETNPLLDHNTAIAERGRAYAWHLTHALKIS